MQLAAGTRLGPYEIVAPVGSGGMGDVYKARDTRLQRTVAIKVLPPHLLSDPAFRARFEREARAISSLDHPNICVVHDVGQDNGLEYLVMQYLDGQTLAERLARGPLPLREALRLATEIAAALDKAHRAGILHRDVKPGNVMLVKSAGQPVSARLLDFGLSKPAMSSDPARAGATVTSPLTARGTVLGTLLYMSPEQLEGADVDARSDIFSFGATLYEMVTGRRPFEGASQASIIAAILEREPPPLTAVGPVAPAALDRVIRKCLAKDRERRWQSAADLRDELAWIAESTDAPSAEAPAAPRVAATPSRVSRVLIGVAGVLAVIAAAALVISKTVHDDGPRVSLARELGIDPGDRLRLARGGIATSPDGRSIVFAARDVPESTGGEVRVGPIQLYVRRFDSSEVTAIPGTGGARTPFFSPDGQSVGFFAAGALKIASLRGGTPQRVTSVPPVTRGAVWLPDNSIVLCATQSSQLLRLGADGKAVSFTKLLPGEQAHMWPQLLPGGKEILYTIRRGTPSDFDASDIGVVTIATGEQRLVFKGGGGAKYSPTGHLLFVRGRALHAVPFDLRAMQVTGSPVPIATGLAVDASVGGAHYAVAGDGTILYLRGEIPRGGATAVWVDRTGKDTPAIGIPGRQPMQPRVSPDGSQVVFNGDSPNGDDEIYVGDLRRGTTIPISGDPADDFTPAWTRDGRQIIWTTLSAGRLPFLVMRAADGTGRSEELFKQDNAQFPGSVSPSRVMAYTLATASNMADIWTVALDGERKGHPFIETPAYEHAPEFSPDGKWIAYVSNETGPENVYVVPYPGPGPKKRVSTQGGVSPAWSRDGAELYFQSDQGMMVTRVSYGATIEFDAPRLLFAGDFVIDSRDDGPRAYDVTDGRFLMMRAVPPPPSRLSFHVLIDWVGMLKPEARQ